MTIVSNWRNESVLGRLVSCKDLIHCTDSLRLTTCHDGDAGTVFRASASTGTYRELAIKLCDASLNNRSLDHEYRILSQLRGIAGIPQPIWFGLESGRHVLVLNYLGRSLEDVFDMCGRTFSVGTVCMIADRLVRFSLFFVLTIY